MTDVNGAGVLAQLSDALAGAVETAARSTVTVNARRRLPASGVLWRPGVVVTADHVIEREESIVVTLADGRTPTARIAGRDPGSDLAVLRIDDDAAPAATLAPAGSARPGHLVLAVGRPSADGPMASLGVVSTVGGPWRTNRGLQVDGYLRTDTTLFPGFSGGPLVDTAGSVIGINSSQLGRGAGLTIPATAVTAIISQLLAGGRVRRGYLGIGSQPVRLPETLAAKADGQETALLIVNVEPGTPAAAAGLLIDDVLIGLAGSPVRDTDDLQALLSGDRAGQPAVIAILRGGERAEVTAVIGERN